MVYGTSLEPEGSLSMAFRQSDAYRHSPQVVPHTDSPPFNGELEVRLTTGALARKGMPEGPGGLARFVVERAIASNSS